MTRAEELPDLLPIFPLSGALLLPHGQLPLNIFEPRYLAMTRDALAGSSLIGMVQPADSDDGAFEPAVFQVGCAGRITQHRDTPDGRILLTLTGVCRFEIVQELQRTTPYRQVIVDYRRFQNDLQPDPGAGIDRAAFMAHLKSYADVQSLQADWASIERASNESLIDALAMVCPFTPGEKQALLEAPTLADRARIMISLMDLALAAARNFGDPGAGTLQ